MDYLNIHTIFGYNCIYQRCWDKNACFSFTAVFVPFVNDCFNGFSSVSLQRVRLILIKNVYLQISEVFHSYIRYVSDIPRKCVMRASRIDLNWLSNGIVVISWMRTFTPSINQSSNVNVWLAVEILSKHDIARKSDIKIYIARTSHLSQGISNHRQLECCLTSLEGQQHRIYQGTILPALYGGNHRHRLYKTGHLQTLRFIIHMVTRIKATVFCDSSLKLHQLVMDPVYLNLFCTRCIHSEPFSSIILASKASIMLMVN